MGIIRNYNVRRRLYLRRGVSKFLTCENRSLAPRSRFPPISPLRPLKGEPKLKQIIILPIAYCLLLSALQPICPLRPTSAPLSTPPKGGT